MMLTLRMSERESIDLTAGIGRRLKLPVLFVGAGWKQINSRDGISTSWDAEASTRVQNAWPRLWSMLAREDPLSTILAHRSSEVLDN